ncbi:MAG: hypothetical protein RL596_1313 [Bacteroidota bacterium]|jgi:PHD/YefM family antitoxin component YafN of YafNO toxin-antitoxin module
MKTITTTDLLTNTDNCFDFTTKKSKPIKVKGESKDNDIVLMSNKEYRSLMETSHSSLTTTHYCMVYRL